jgi:hypothetical protein
MMSARPVCPHRGGRTGKAGLGAVRCCKGAKVMSVSVDKKPLPIGQSSFERVVEDGYYYIDKTLLVKDILDRKAAVTLCTRPRRFGKTLNQTMLKCFFEDTAQAGGKDTRALFRGLKIEGAGERYMAEQGKYPVIFLSFKEAKFDTFEGAYDGLKDCIAREFERHAYVAEKISNNYDKNLFKKLSDRTGSVFDYSLSLKFLSKRLEDYHGKRAVILIDEYDVPLQKSWSFGYFDKLIEFIRPLLGSALKDNPHLQFAVMTGCLRISKESIFTGLNHLDVISILSKNYSEYFGFTQKEMDAMLEYYGFSDKTRIVRDWYNGYLFGNTEVYNPWSSLHVIRSWVTDTDELPKPYWLNTSDNAIIREMINKSNAETKGGLESLMSGGTVSAVVRDGVTYDEIHKNADNLWNFLLFTGYLKKVGESVDYIERIVLEMKIPNKELNIIFEDKIKEWFDDKIANETLDALRCAVLNGDAETLQNELSALLSETISYMDGAENFYHGFMAGVLARIDGYVLKSNRESGDGRSDLVLYSANQRDGKAFIFELKTAKEFDGLPAACEDALKQIEERNYAAAWVKEGYKNIVKYGIGFYKKVCEARKA